MPVAVSIITALAAGVLAARVITFIALSIPRCFYLSWIIRSNFLTENEIHKSNISFTKAMETIANPLNIVLKTKFSTYYKSIMPSGKSYFIKKLNRSDKIFQNEKFEQELEIIGKLNHSNVMTPLAYALTKDSAYLFYEYAQTCTLFDILHSSNGSSMDWESRYSVAVGLAQGLAFLNGCTSGPILLLDLSSKNIMLKSLKEPQLGDIELCKVIDPSKRTGSLSTVTGSVGYIPPEYAYTMREAAVGNVYSFRVILLELLTRRPPISEGTELAKLVLHNWEHEDKRDEIFDVNIYAISLAIKNQMLAVLEVAIACVSVLPEGRPKMNVVLQMLQNANTLT
ncbi:leucine-rich repeat receptor-like tyrosine-protein kinase PXC3 [Pistacia vera]|uniref:leucine-rich repeat receptor-like tyrosine-protein kinase PXC3 n=1 Tax=Pistacia vera TaxID=55513 RepID=UPI001263C6C8|nr:leucine-rich repeat receptor-like tyrosine-protein kinase PXC3 [Pistacia vera]